MQLTFQKKYCTVLIFLCINLLVNLASANETNNKPLLIHSALLFDGYQFHENTSLLIRNDKIEKVAKRSEFSELNTTNTDILDLGNSTLLPGFIELHAHLNYRHVPEDTVLQHGITTLRDVGGPSHAPYGGKGALRVLSAGSLLTAVDGYPIPLMGENSATAIHSEAHARETVRQLVAAGAIIIKVALEPGGEQGAPWSSNHHAAHGHSPDHHAPKEHSAWPLLSEPIVKAIVDEAHKLERKVTAHVGEQQGVEIALNSGIDEWAHMPCAAIPKHLLEQAVSQGVKIISTLDTLSKCTGLNHNATTLASLGANFLYGAEIAHPDIPWGIDVQELLLMQSMQKMTLNEVLNAATAKSGEHLNIPLLGTLKQGAPADIIAVQGDPRNTLKTLEYPQLVISGGQAIKNSYN